jgi:hypothetical protein
LNEKLSPFNILQYDKMFVRFKQLFIGVAFTSQNISLIDIKFQFFFQFFRLKEYRVSVFLQGFDWETCKQWDSMLRFTLLLKVVCFIYFADPSFKNYAFVIKRGQMLRLTFTKKDSPSIQGNPSLKITS